MTRRKPAQAALALPLPDDVLAHQAALRARDEHQHRGTTREQLEPILRRLGKRWHGGHWVDPCAGEGEIPALCSELLSGLSRSLPKAWTLYEIRNWQRGMGFGGMDRTLEAAWTSSKYGNSVAWHRPANFLAASGHSQDVELVVTNLPWPSPGLAIVDRGFSLYPHAEVLVLVDLCLFLRDWQASGQERSSWLARHAPDIYTLPGRQRFAGETGGYPHACAWLHWPAGQRDRTRGQWEVLRAQE